MNERILCVDDDPCVLQAYQRALRKKFIIEGALGGEEALELIAHKGPYAVVVADMRMPGMNGIQLLVKVREMAPDSVRMMLTGNADQQTALDAVNEGHIFRFMTKPCPPEVFAKALESGLAQYRLINAERELLSHTLSGGIKVLTDVLGLVNPVAFSRASRVHRLVRQMCGEMGLQRTWMIEIAAMLSQIGCVAVSQDTLTKVFQGEKLSLAEEKVFLEHPQTGRELLINIPRLEEVAEIIAHQNDLYHDRQNIPHESRAAETVLGAYLLKAALDWDTLVSGGMNYDLAMAVINDRKTWYHPDVLAALRKVMHITDVRVVRRVLPQEISDGAVLAEDVRSVEGALLCAKGQEVTPSMRAFLRNYVVNVGIQTPIKVFVPAADENPLTGVLFPATSGAAPASRL